MYIIRRAIKGRVITRHRVCTGRSSRWRGVRTREILLLLKIPFRLITHVKASAAGASRRQGLHGCSRHIMVSLKLWPANVVASGLPVAVPANAPENQGDNHNRTHCTAHDSTDDGACGRGRLILRRA